MSIDQIDFQKAAQGIIKKLGEWMPAEDEAEKIRFVYNHGIDDAITFVDNLGKANPQYRLAYMSLVKEMKHYLPLRKP